MNKECDINTNSLNIVENYEEGIPQKIAYPEDSSADIKEISFPEKREVYYSSEKTEVSYYVDFNKLNIQKILFELNTKQH
jgi:hypothetical protein